MSSAPPRSWTLEDRLPRVSGNASKGTCLMSRQIFIARSRKGCGLQVGDDTLATEDRPYTIHFTPVVSPLQQSFDLEFIPEAEQTTKAGAPARDVIAARFSAHEGIASTEVHRPHDYKGIADVDDSPLGSFSLSSQLYEVRFRQRDRFESTSKLKLNMPVADQAEVEWRAKAFTKFGWSRDLSKLPPATRTAANKFMDMLEAAANKKLKITIVMLRQKDFFKSIWPRFASLPSPSPPSYWPWMHNARTAVEKFTPNSHESAEEQIKALNKLQKDELAILRQVQRLYVAGARVVFSTASKASNVVMGQFNPKVVSIDEASQTSEAKAAHVIAHACREGREPQRILLVGDHHQLPPSMFAERNAMAETAKVSLFERLVAAETPFIQLKTQYRSHSQISAIFNKVIYNNSLQNGPAVDKKPETITFSRFALDLLSAGDPTAQKRFSRGTSSPVPIASLVFSVSRYGPFRWGAVKRPNSTSRQNSQTACLAIFAALKLVTEHKIKADQIMITTFYRDQLNLLKFMASGWPALKGMRIMTVDGSQGEETLIQIIDCVVLGGKVPDGAQDTLGFLGTERRRFNVAMSRGQAARLVIGHQLMGRFEKKFGTSVWDTFMQMEKDAGHIVDTSTFADSWSKGPDWDAMAAMIKRYVNEDSSSQTVSMERKEKKLVRSGTANLETLARKLVDEKGLTADEAEVAVGYANGDLEVAYRDME